ncbi:unnamed protein product [Echinostoma caproni]|uniref:SPX domain-containing protein n=1 Tax=Echinostoma caproni TaxID=27848 RepID=A0A183B122_9TREM|nr:unnamed protein product [Echinostoma caproni]
MRALPIYTKTFMLKIKEVLMKHHDAWFEYQSIFNCKNTRSEEKANGGATFVSTVLDKMTVPTVLSNSVRSLFEKLPDLPYLLQRNGLCTSCIICLQESWFNGEENDSGV